MTDDASVDEELQDNDDEQPATEDRYRQSHFGSDAGSVLFIVLKL